MASRVSKVISDLCLALHIAVPKNHLRLEDDAQLAITRCAHQAACQVMFSEKVGLSCVYKVC